MSKLTIGMCTYDDFHGVYFSIQSLRMHHPVSDTQFIVVDNNPTSKHGRATKDFCDKWLGKEAYVPYTLKKSTCVRNEIFKRATGDYTLCMDCHVMFMPGAIQSLLDFYEENPESTDLVQGPLMYDGLKGSLTHFRPIWGEQMYGRWGTDHEGLKHKEAFDIPMQGLGIFSCKTSNWRGFNKLFKGFGGEEGYIHEKFRQYGGRTLCLPGLKWVHRFGRPDGVQYPLNIEDRIWNYFIGWYELGDQAMVDKITEVFSKRISPARVDQIREEARKATS